MCMYLCSAFSFLSERENLLTKLLLFFLHQMWMLSHTHTYLKMSKGVFMFKL